MKMKNEIETAHFINYLKGTLRENILLGVDESTVTDEMIYEVCRQASIHDFIVSLPEGYNTDIGSRGVSLSGGQRQRVSIARALIRNPDVLLLDEATSALDSESENQVQAAFERAGKGRTMVAVAHRLATVQNADVIFVLGDGKLLEKGNHQELLAKRSVYWQMVSLQEPWCSARQLHDTLTCELISARAKPSIARPKVTHPDEPIFAHFHGKFESERKENPFF